MSEPGETGMDTSSDPPPVKQVRTEEPQAPFGQDEPNPDVVSDMTADEKGGGPVDPAPGGYGDRDPKEEMPTVPSAAENQDDPSHSGAPKTDSEPPASH